MTPQQFRRVALSFPEVTEGEHMRHPDFRVHGKIFATLSYPDATCGMVKLTPEQQAEFVSAEPQAYVPVNGGWGRRGATTVKLRAAKRLSLRRALAAAWCNAAPRALAQNFEKRFG